METLNRRETSVTIYQDSHLRILTSNSDQIWNLFCSPVNVIILERIPYLASELISIIFVANIFVLDADTKCVFLFVIIL